MFRPSRAAALPALLGWVVSAQAQDPFDAFDEFEDESAVALGGFVEAAYGQRLDSDPNFDSRRTLSEVRTRLDVDWSGERIRLAFAGDARYDDYQNDFTGEIRELSAQLSPGTAVDLKLGRQIMTWGTGDLLFLNDLFPKDWVSFFAGRDDEYLKAPSDALRLTWYTDRVNVDVVWSPEFDPDNYLNGERFSFFSPWIGAIVAPNPPLSAKGPSGGEIAMRLFRTVGSVEYAGYFYSGYFKRPIGLDTNFAPTFPALSVFGGSLRRPMAGGLFNAEIAYHDSRQDRRGIDALIPNDQVRLLVGYEFEAMPRFTVGLQYYLEWTQDHASLLANSPSPAFEPDEYRHVLTNRLTYRGSRDRLTLSLFTFYSPNDDDSYLRPVVSYRQSDRWMFTAGANLFAGERPSTFFGQLEDNSNAYLRARFSF
jgi:hypothetical protein